MPCLNPACSLHAGGGQVIFDQKASVVKREFGAEKRSETMGRFCRTQSRIYVDVWPLPTIPAQ